MCTDWRLGWRSFIMLLSALSFWLICIAYGRAADLSTGPSLNPGVLASVPPLLHPWIDWVLQDRPDRRCPVVYNALDQRQCLWPSTLTFDLDEQSGQFVQQVYTDQEDWLTLPGDRRHWPQEVRLDDLLAPVMERNGLPALKLPFGAHRISGRFRWRELPESIRIPVQNGLLEVRVNGKPMPTTRLVDDGVLWLRQRSPEPAQQDHLDLQVFRLLADGIPFVVTTWLELRVSGQAREEMLGPVLLPDFLPLALNSPLPARLEADGRLRVQLRPGHWVLHLTARHRGPLEALAQPALAAPWPQQEIWSFQAQNALRVVQVSGAPALDPAQTSLPMAWRQWPAYLLASGDGLRFTTRARGDSETAPEMLTLDRALWLDFSGGGYTVQDRLSGNLNGTRLETAPTLHLGRVEINGVDQFITQLSETGTTGVEIRQSTHLQLVADSRMEPAAIGDLPAVGWRLAPRTLSVALNLPPGWRLLAAAGPDTAEHAWLPSWNLLDIFVVLVIAFGFARLWHWSWGLVALLGVGLNYHEANVPLYVWLNVLAAIALLRVLPSGRVRTLVKGYRVLALLTLIAIGALFAVQQIRSALYPQLEPFTFAALVSGPDQVFIEKTAQSEVYEQGRSPVPSAITPPKQNERLKKFQQQYTPDIKVQTGPGLPVWSWRQAYLRWNGPVAADERLRLWLLPPWISRPLLLVGLGLLLMMVARLLISSQRGSLPAAIDQEKPSLATLETTKLTLLLSLTLASFLLVAPAPAIAQIPSQALLDQLRERLIRPPDCQPCADLAALALSIQDDTLQLRLSLHAQADTAAPLPLPREGLTVSAITLDGLPAMLRRDPTQGLWLRLPAGLHEVTVTAAIPDTVATLQLPLPMTPGQFELHAEGWLVEGYVEGRVDQQLQLTRQRQTAAAPLQAGLMPPFVQVEREIVLDVDWRVETRVQRLSQPDSATVVEIPLLPGERVTTPAIQVRAGRVLLNLPPEQTEVSWSATLDRSAALVLQAVESKDWIEIWRLRASPLWHAQQQAGIPPVRRVDAGGEWLPEWRPWPGERVDLQITRPEGAPGATATIDQSRLQLNPGHRLSEATLEMTVRTSRGVDHVVTLPTGATLTEARIDEVQQPIRQQEGQVILPLTPGVQRIVLGWRDERGIAMRYTTPAVDLGAPSVNSTLSVSLPRDRWVLFVGGPVMGPAVLFWGMLLAILLGSVILARVADTPWRVHHWFLLGVGLSQSHLLALLLVGGWWLLLAYRKRLADRELSAVTFDLMQIALAVLTLIVGAVLLAAVEQGLLGPPDMQVAGHHSSAWQLHWYQDRTTGLLPTAWVLSAPMWLYRGLMLAWALWLALAVLRWLGWAWSCFSAGGLWRRLRKLKPANTG